MLAATRSPPCARRMRRRRSSSARLSRPCSSCRKVLLRQSENSSQLCSGGHRLRRVGVKGAH
jgi:hypothetical protein